ncbi:MAG TPA: hypothetical protein VM662_14655 [Sphingomonas sp.]|nr:hypothetical protein [Sphingomonas sp.]
MVVVVVVTSRGIRLVGSARAVLRSTRFFAAICLWMIRGCSMRSAT